MPRKSETTREGNRPNNGSHVRLSTPDRAILFIVFAVYDGCI